MKNVIVVKDKWTYVLMLISICCFIWLIYDSVACFVLHTVDSTTYFERFLPVLLIGLLSFYLFVRLNSYSSLFNPDHPMHKDETKK
ncbi:hypothetical protein A4S06_09430 [Erysipelotrichaceae bacterium MTC7]|nr:hypothetical protein A4S06_09430 [Erysipelotrichaceae bacterium MTC7]